MCYFWVYWILWLLFVFLDHLWLFVGVICSWSLVSLCTHLCVWQQWRTCYTKNTVLQHIWSCFSVTLLSEWWRCFCRPVDGNVLTVASLVSRRIAETCGGIRTLMYISPRRRNTTDLRGKSPHRNWAGVREEHTHCGLLPLLFGLFSL